MEEDYWSNIDSNTSLYDEADNGSGDSQAGWLSSLQKTFGVVLDTAAKIAPTALQIIGSGKGTPQQVAAPQAPVVNKFPEAGQAKAGKNYMPWLIGGGVALTLGIIGFLLFKRSK